MGFNSGFKGLNVQEVDGSAKPLKKNEGHNPRHGSNRWLVACKASNIQPCKNSDQNFKSLCNWQSGPSLHTASPSPGVSYYAVGMTTPIVSLWRPMTIERSELYPVA